MPMFRERIIGPNFPYLAVPPAVSAYHANGVTFNGTDVMLERAGSMTGGTSSKLGLISLWFKLNGTDSAYQVWLESATSNFIYVFRKPDNTIQVSGAGGMSLNMFTSSTFTAGGGWHHLLASWDVGASSGAGRRQLYIDGTLNMTGDTSTDAASNYAAESDWCFGNRTGPDSFWANADFADVYVNLAETLDLATPANVQLFRSTAGKPVNLGTDGSTPTGNSPLIFLSNSASTFHLNNGLGEDFAVIGGGLVGTATSPSD